MWLVQASIHYIPAVLEVPAVALTLEEMVVEAQVLQAVMGNLVPPQIQQLRHQVVVELEETWLLLEWMEVQQEMEAQPKMELPVAWVVARMPVLMVLVVVVVIIQTVEQVVMVLNGILHMAQAVEVGVALIQVQEELLVELVACTAEVEVEADPL